MLGRSSILICLSLLTAGIPLPFLEELPVDLSALPATSLPQDSLDGDPITPDPSTTPDDEENSDLGLFAPEYGVVDPGQRTGREAFGRKITARPRVAWKEPIQAPAAASISSTDLAADPGCSAFILRVVAHPVRCHAPPRLV